VHKLRVAHKCRASCQTHFCKEHRGAALARSSFSSAE
jgi:hypothetical protein